MGRFVQGEDRRHWTTRFVPASLSESIVELIAGYVAVPLGRAPLWVDGPLAGEPNDGGRHGYSLGRRGVEATGEVATTLGVVAPLI